MNDLKVSGFQTWKYMDDTNVGKGSWVTSGVLFMLLRTGCVTTR